MEGNNSNLKSEKENSPGSDSSASKNNKNEHTSASCESKTTSVSQLETNNSENENNFENSIKKLFRVRQIDNSPRQTFDVYMNKLNGLYSDHIDTLIHEKSDLNIELQNIQKRQKENHNLTIARVDTLISVLNSWSESDKFSDKAVKKVIQEKIKYYTNFKKIVIQLTGQNPNSTPYQKHIKCESITRRCETTQLRRELKDREDEVEELKKEMEEKIKNLRAEHEKKLEMSEFKCDINYFLKHLIQTQVELQEMGKEVSSELKDIQQTISDDKNFDDKSCLEDGQKSSPATTETSPRKRASKIDAILNQQLELIQNKIQTFHKEFKSQSVAIRQAFNKLRAKKAEDTSKFKVQLAVAKKELEKCKSNQSKPVQDIIQKAEADSKMLTEELALTLQELSALQMDCYMKEGTIDDLTEKKEQALAECSQAAEKISKLESEQAKLQEELDETRDVLEECDRTFKQKVLQEQLIAKKLKETEKKVKTLQSQLAGTQHELAIVSKENSRLKNFQKTMK